MGFNNLYPGKVDLIMADSCKMENFNLPVTFYLVTSRNPFSRYLSLLTGSLHRFKGYVLNFLSQKKDNYFMCVFDGSLIAGDMVDYINSLGIKTVTIHHNYEKEYHMDNKSVECFKGIFPYYVIRNERNAYLKSSLNLFLTTQDKNTLLNVYGKSQGIIKVIGVYEPENENLKTRSKQSINEIIMVISGTMSSYQTINGIFDFYKKYHTFVKVICPNVKIIFTGRNPDKRLIQMIDNEQGIMQMISNPEDIDFVVKQGNIYLCPTNIGGGLKLRLMDGLRAGLPILVHAVSARGYDVFYNKPWFKVYNNEESFRTGLTLLVDWVTQGNWSPAEIQKAYLDYFSFNAGVARLEEYVSCF
ncbi:MAG: hypothetical protein NTY95_15495 [Bacteroidia bacterium]|nr:hypothetical protein [Bacteroidia bacterium]